jgi:predicted O-linked N-acetylglucosamine transferase (SPINDLY family)
LSLEEAQEHLRAGKPGLAAALLEAHLRRNPSDPEALFLLGLGLEDLGRFEDALSAYEGALAAAPDLEDALHNRGLLLVRGRRLDEARSNYSDYLRRHPDSARARNGLTDVLLAQGRFLETLDTAGHDGPGLVRKGVALACLRRFEEAQKHFELAREREPHEVALYLQRVAPAASIDTALSPLNIYLWRQYVALGECDWSDWESFVAQMRSLVGQPEIQLEPAVTFMALHLPLTASERLAIARRIAAGFEAQIPVMGPPSRRRRTRLRIGLLSPDFREHLNAYLLLPLVQLLDRARFEVYTYPLGARDGSVVRVDVDAAADKVIPLHGMTDAQAAWRIRNDDIDILLDVAGHTTGGRFGITARRPARLQMLYLGFPASLGSGRVDYAIVDETVQGESGEWAEALIRLPSTYYLYDFRAPAEDPALARQDYGLPETAFVFCAFHKPEKITPDAFELWMDILSPVPRSVLWFLALSPAARENLQRSAAARGIAPGRIMFAPFELRPRYLARQRLGDLLLDAVHHSAMTTACDALGGGLPVLTLRGTTMASRAGESLLRAAGLPELVAADRQDFISRAIELASDSRQLEELKSRLVGHRSHAPLFDTACRVAELQAAFTEAMQRFDAGDKPTSFSVPTQA